MTRWLATCMLVTMVLAIRGSAEVRPRGLFGAVSARDDFGARGDQSADDTEAIQSCIDYAASHDSTCFIAPGVYTITGNGLHIFVSGTSVTSWSPEGRGQAQLRYHGRGSALTIGDGVHMLYAVDLANLAVVAADRTTAALGIDCRLLSGGRWAGIVVGGGATSGRFATGLRFVDSGRIEVQGLIVSNRQGIVGSTGVLFDDRNTVGNSHIVLNGGDLFNQNIMYDIRQCVHCVIQDIFHEGYDTAIRLDASEGKAGRLAVINLIVQNNYFLASLRDTYRKRKVIEARATAERAVWVPSFVFSGNYVFNAGGVVAPISLAIASGKGGSVMNLVIRDGAYPGTETALVVGDCDCIKVCVEGGPYLKSADGVTVPAVFVNNVAKK